MEDVLVHYESLTGNHLIRTPNLEATVTIVQNPDKDMTTAEAINFIRTALFYHGIAILPESPGVERVISWQGQAPFNLPAGDASLQPELYNNPSELPEGREFVNYAMQLDHVGAEDAAQQFALLMPPQTGRYTPIPNSSTVIVSETVPVVRTLIAFKEKIDVPELARENRFVQLRLADAEEVAGSITELISAQEQLRSQGSSGRVGAGVAARGLQNNNQGNVPVPLQGANANGRNTNAGQITISTGSGVIVQADARTNRILLNGRKGDVNYIEGLVKEFDQPAEVETLLTKQLRYFSVIDFLDVAATSLERFSSRGAGAGGPGGSGLSQNRSNRQSRTGGNTGFQGNQLNSGGFTNSRTGSSRGGTTGSRGSLGGGAGARLQTQQLFPESITVDKTLLIADPRSNSVIVSGPPEHLGFIEDLIDKMDVRPLQVYISAVLGAVSLDENMEFGIDILRTVETFDVNGTTVDAAGFYRNLTNGTGILDPNSLQSVEDFSVIGAASGFNTYANIGDYLTGYLRALETRNDFRVLARPFVYTANNEVATISIGERVPVPAAQQSTVVSGGTQSLNTSIDYVDVLLELQVAPLINSENEVTLTVSQINDNILGSTQINGDDIPIIGTQNLDTTVTVPNGGVVVIGGLISRTETKGKAGLPFITKLPLLGTLLGSGTKRVERNELLIFLQPKIIDDSATLVSAHTDQVRRTIIADDAEEFAVPEYNTRDLVDPRYEGDVYWDHAGNPNPGATQGDGVEETENSDKKKRKKRGFGQWIKGLFNKD